MRDGERESAAELLRNWRAAERDKKAAEKAAKDAARAVVAASKVEEAAVSETAADATVDAGARAKDATGRARKAASGAVEAAHQATEMATHEKARADRAVMFFEDAEADARERFHEAQERGFQKDSDEPQSPRLEPNPESG